jgi:alkaline phosphatase D
MAFGDEKLENIIGVGTVDHRSARLWFRAAQPGTYAVEVKGPGGALHGRTSVVIKAGNTNDNTATLVYPGAPTLGDLTPLTRYNVHVASEDGLVVVGEATFETAPAGPKDAPADFSIGVFSCHQPFSSEGEVSPNSMRLLNQLPAYFQSNNVKFLLNIGDQIYADTPGPFALMSPVYSKQRWGKPFAQLSPAEMRVAFQERYRIWWKQTPWLKLLNSYPNYPILDDHEVFDDWGSVAAHESEPYRSVIQAGRLAYLDYQGSRCLPWQADGGGVAPSSFDYSFSYGQVATFVFDLRSERRMVPEPRVFSPEQLARFKAFLAANRQAEVVLVVTSVPLVHLPEWVTSWGEKLFGTSVDFPDHWSAPHNQKDRDQVLDAIRDHLSLPETKRQRLIVLGGDVHVGCAFTLRFVNDAPGGAKPLIYEFTTSAITNRIQGLTADFVLLGPEAFGVTTRMAHGKVDVSLLPAAQNAGQANPTPELNVGIVECKRNGDETNVRLKLIEPGPTGARVAFESGWL